MTVWYDHDTQEYDRHMIELDEDSHKIYNTEYDNVMV